MNRFLKYNNNDLTRTGINPEHKVLRVTAENLQNVMC